MSSTTQPSAAARLAAMPVRIDAVALGELAVGGRRSVLVRMTGAGCEGVGEDVTHDAADRRAFLALEAAVPRGVTTLGELSGLLDDWAPLGGGVTWPVVRSYRRWALESAACDLALRQAGTHLAAVLGHRPRPVRYVVSARVDDAAAVERLLAAHPGARLKLDARAGWTRDTVRRIAATGAVEVIDLKGTAPGSSVHEPPDEARYRALAEAFPDALFEDPDPALAHVPPRVAWDEPVRGDADLDGLPPAAAVNVKAGRVGSLAGVMRLVEACRARGIEVYGGGHSEIGPGRGQARLIAALMYPDGPNDLAPPAGGPPSPLVPPTDLSGYRWGWPASG